MFEMQNLTTDLRQDNIDDNIEEFSVTHISIKVDSKHQKSNAVISTRNDHIYKLR